MTPLTDYDLSPHNSLALSARAAHYCAVHSLADARQAFAWARRRRLDTWILGGGSNVVLRAQIPQLVIQPRFTGIHLLGQQGDEVRVRVAAAEPWHRVVCHCLHQGWYGLENLALIPGHAGAAPVQNIGAYGVELSDRLINVEVLDQHSGAHHALAADDCQFGYRDSVFKRQGGKRWLITALQLRLSRHPASTQTHYHSLAQQLRHWQIERPQPEDVFRAVCHVRQQRLPDPEQWPNAGSFFKNPVVSSAQFEGLQRQYPNLISFASPHGGVKLAAGWLIEQCGLKTLRYGPIGLYPKQALVLVNRGGAGAQQVLDFARMVQTRVYARFGVSLEIEPNVV